jgi:hypothetical protein
MVALVIFCYLIAYLFLAVYAAVKTPKLVAVFLKGAGAAGAFLSTFATGLIAGAATGLASAAVGGSGLAGALLGASPMGRTDRPGVRSSAGQSQTAASFNRGPAAAASDTARRPSLGQLLASSPRPVTSADRPVHERPARPDETGGSNASQPARSAAYAEAAGFGLRTLADCLRAGSPGDGWKIAVKALREHRKQQEKAAEARHKLRRQSEKP